MGFFDFLKKANSLPQVEDTYKDVHNKPRRKYDVQLDRITNEGSPNCRHDWRYIPNPRVDTPGFYEWAQKYGDPFSYEGRLECIRHVYACRKCEAECTMLLSVETDRY